MLPCPPAVQQLYLKIRAAPFQSDQPQKVILPGLQWFPCRAARTPKPPIRSAFRLNLLRLCAEDAALPSGSGIVQENVLICLQNKELRSPRLHSPIRWQQMQQHLQIAMFLLQRETGSLSRAQRDLQKKRLPRTAKSKKYLYCSSRNRV